MSEHIKICREFCAKLKKQSALTKGMQHGGQLRPFVSKLLEDFANLYGCGDFETAPEQYISESKVRPDITVYLDDLICGRVELKNPSIDLGAHRLDKRNKKQRERLSSLPNVLHTNGREWKLFHWERIAKEVRFPKDPISDGADGVDAESASGLNALLRDFLGWDPNTPHEPSGLTEHLARLTQILREEAGAALRRKDSSILILKEDLRKFFSLSSTAMGGLDVADVIAQAVAYPLLWARLEWAPIYPVNKKRLYQS